MMDIVHIPVPDLGNFKDVAVIDVLVKIGDHVDVDSALATLETEKATMDVPSPFAGVVAAIHIAKGNVVNAGDRIVSLRADAAPPATSKVRLESETLTIEAPAVAGADTVKMPIPAPLTLPAAPSAQTPTPTRALAAVDEAAFSSAHAGPSVRKLARELGVSLGQVSGSGIKGRVTHEDVKSWVKRALSGGVGVGTAVGGAFPRVAAVDFAAIGPVEIKPLTRVQKISGPRLHAAWVNLPHVTQFDEADITELEDARTKLKQRTVQQGIKLTPLAFLVRACVKALAQFPKFNSSLDEAGANLVYKQYVHIGFAADTPNGLLVPVIRDADRRDVYEIARLLGELSEKARQGKLSAAEMQGGCFTISSLGGIGGTQFTPIINAPEVAILGVSRSSMKPVYRDGSFVPRLMLSLSLSYDHRVIDGAEGARFTSFLAAMLADPRQLLEAVP